MRNKKGAKTERTNFVKQYDYVIDSDSKFQALCDGSVSGVRDVLIRAGTWTASDGSSWNLDTTGTKQVFGEVDSVLRINDPINGIIVKNTEIESLAPSACLIENVTLEFTGNGIGFLNCNNLENCSVLTRTPRRGRCCPLFSWGRLLAGQILWFWKSIGFKIK